MINKVDAICVGCGQTATATGEYGKDNPVQDDGTYADNKFVCTDCYCKLIPLGLDIGSPQQLQSRIRNLMRKQ